MISHINNQAGSSVIETLLVIKVLAFTFTSVLSVSFYFYGKVSIQNILHETIVCSIREEDQSFCKSQAEQRLNRVMFFGRLKKINISKGSKYTKGTIEWTFLNQFKKYQINHKHKLLNTLIKPAKRALL